MHEIEIRREVAHRLDATFKVLSAKIGKHGSATHHLANVLGAMSIAFTGSLSNWPEVVEYAGKLAAALRDEDLNEWRKLVSDAETVSEMRLKAFVVFRNADERKGLCKIFVHAGPRSTIAVIVIIPGVCVPTIFYDDRPSGRVVCKLVDEHNLEQVAK